MKDGSYELCLPIYNITCSKNVTIWAISTTTTLTDWSIVYCVTMFILFTFHYSSIRSFGHSFFLTIIVCPRQLFVLCTGFILLRSWYFYLFLRILLLLLWAYYRLLLFLFYFFFLVFFAQFFLINFGLGRIVLRYLLLSVALLLWLVSSWLLWLNMLLWKTPWRLEGSQGLL